MARVLVTGGAGYIGSHTVRQLIREGHEIAVIDDLSNGHKEALGPDSRLVVADLSDDRVLDEVLSDFSPEAAIHFAAAIEPNLSVSHPKRFYETNVIGTLVLARELAKHHTPVVFSSSCAVYGNPTVLPVDESGALAPESLYGETKVIGEQILDHYDHAYGLRHISLRYFNAAGADPSGENGADHRERVHLFTVACLAALGVLSGVEIFGDDYDTADGTCIRDYVHVEDLARAHVLAVDALLSGATSKTYNVGVGEGHSVRAVLAAVERASGRSFPIHIAKRREGDPAAIFADGTLIRSDLGWAPRLSSLEDMAATSWRWHSSHPDGWQRRDREAK